jgi:hypothetical protein
MARELGNIPEYFSLHGKGTLEYPRIFQSSWQGNFGISQNISVFMARELWNT